MSTEHSPSDMFLSRKMLCLDRRIGLTIARVYDRAVNRTMTTDNIGADDEVERTPWSMTRLNMNLFRFDRRATTQVLGDQAYDVAAAATATRRKVMKRTCRYTNTAALQRLISVIMQDVQQRNLNAKHTASSTAAINTGYAPPPSEAECGRDDSAVADSGAKNYDPTIDRSCIPLNRSCAQRKSIEVCCVLYTGADVATFLRYFHAGVVLHVWSPTPTISATTANGAVSPSQRCSLVKGIIERKFLGQVLLKFQQLPRLAFVSCKNALYIGGNLTNFRLISKLTDPMARMSRRLLYVANFILYHIFHESNESFDSRQFGSRHRYMRGLLFILALVNVQMLDVSNGRNANLALNMQSLGKSYGDVGLQIFGENSIQYVSKVHSACSSESSSMATVVAKKRSAAANTVVVPAATAATATAAATKGSGNEGRSSTDSNDDTRLSLPAAKSWRFATNGLLVNRCLGRVSEIGINAVHLTRSLRPIR